MNWIALHHLHEVNEIKKAKGYHLIFKHSTRCSVSLMAKKRFEMDWDLIPAATPLYFLDLISYREISAHIAEIFQVPHESPQLLLIKDGECILEASHSDISAHEIAQAIKA